MLKEEIVQILLWVLGAFFLFGAITELTSNAIISGLLIFIASILIIPTTYTFINKSTKYKIKSPSIRLLIIIILLSFGISLSSNEFPQTQTNTQNIENQTQKQQQINSSIVNENVDNNKSKNELATVISITDGDTLKVLVNNAEITIRLIGINTPETNHPNEPIQCYGIEAKKELEKLVLNKEVILEKDVSEVDKYDRYLRYIWLDETLVNEYMTQNGYAFSYEYPPDTKYQNRIKQGETETKANLLGLWNSDTCNGNIYTGTYKDPNKILEKPLTTSTNTSVEPSLIYTPPVVTQPTSVKNTDSYSCNCSKTCDQMSSCDEAYYQLNVCGCSARDGDKDGIACDIDCQ